MFDFRYQSRISLPEINPNRKIEMNTKMLSTRNELFQTAEISSWLTRGLLKIVALFKRSELQKAQAFYNFKQNRQTRLEANRGTVRGMPLEQKLQLGCYYLMD